MTDLIARLRAAGVSVWLDDLSRERLAAGGLAALRDWGVSGVTTNPTIFAKAITGSEAYAGPVRDLKVRRAPADQALRAARRSSRAPRAGTAPIASRCCPVRRSPGSTTGTARWR